MEGFVLRGDFQYLVHQIGIGIQFVQRLLEKLDLHIEVHVRRAVEANKPSVDGGIGILAFSAEPFCLAAEVHGVLGDEGPVAPQG